MAEWNSCASLHNNDTYAEAKEKYQELLADGYDPLSYMLMMQFDLQCALSKKAPKYNKRPDELRTLGEKFDWLRENKQAFDDEYREIIDALPGMSMDEKDRSAIWKRWKGKHESVQNMTFENLSENDLKELKYELTDAFHFFMNMFFALGMTAEEMFVFYYFKNAENHRRASQGY